MAAAGNHNTPILMTTMVSTIKIIPLFKENAFLDNFRTELYLFNGAKSITHFTHLSSGMPSLPKRSMQYSHNKTNLSNLKYYRTTHHCTPGTELTNAEMIQ